MERLLRVTNVLLGIIALCLVLLVLSVYNVDTPRVARAQVNTNSATAQPVYLVYWPNGYGSYERVVGQNGVVRTSR
jgi:hypothetical protein